VFQLDAMLEKQGHKVDKVLNFNVEDSVLEERITGRWIHPASGRSYHSKFAPPKVPGIDDVRSFKYFSGCFQCVFISIWSVAKFCLTLPGRRMTSSYFHYLVRSPGNH
jgi:adenylate kinase family enzyme